MVKPAIRRAQSGNRPGTLSLRYVVLVVAIASCHSSYNHRHNLRSASRDTVGVAGEWHMIQTGTVDSGAAWKQLDAEGTGGTVCQVFDIDGSSRNADGSAIKTSRGYIYSCLDPPAVDNPVIVLNSALDIPSAATHGKSVPNFISGKMFGTIHSISAAPRSPGFRAIISGDDFVIFTGTHYPRHIKFSTSAVLGSCAITERPYLPVGECRYARRTGE